MMNKPALELHPNAAKSFDAKASALRELLAPEAPPRREQRPTISPDVHVSAQLGPETTFDEGVVKMQGDPNTRLTGMFFFEEPGTWIGLEGDDYRRLLELAESIQRCSAIADHLSLRFVEVQIFDWLKRNYRSSTDRSLTATLLEAGATAIDESELWIPIPTLSTVVEFRFGKMVFRPITKKLIDKWHEHLRSRVTDIDGLDGWIERLRKQIQGLAAATITVVAEPTRAAEIALAEAERTVAGLRFVAPELLRPYSRSFWAPSTFIDRTGTDVFRLKDGLFEGRQAKAPLDVFGHGPLDRGRLVTLFQGGLARIDVLLRKPDPTSFESDYLNALFQYSKAALTRDPSEKLLYIVSALESILLRETHEGGLGKNLEERLAVLIREDLNERLDLIKNVRRIYRLRSDFVHKSLPVKDLEAMEEFMLDAWTAFRNLLLCSSEFRSKEEFLMDLEQQRLVGPSFRPHQFRVEERSDESE